MRPLYQLTALSSSVLLVYGAVTGLEARQAPSNKPVVGTWNYKGCYQDGTYRTLRVPYTIPAGNSAEDCTSLCESEGYGFAGMEYATECWCDSVMRTNLLEPESECDLICPGDATEYCGGSNRITVYENSTPPPAPSNKPVIGTWNYKGCYLDGLPRTLSVYKATPLGNSAEECIAACTASGYTLAGMEYGNECWCDTVMRRNSLQLNSDCNMVCSGDSLEYCGGSNRLTVYENTAPPPPPSGEPVVGTWNYKGCYTDIGLRTLTFRYTIPTGLNSAEACTALCESEGYGLAGMEYGTECWCDNYMPRGTLKPDSECNFVCPGDSAEYCGSNQRLTLYVNGAGTPPSTSSCIDWRGTYAFQSNILEAVPKAGGSVTRLYRIPTNPTTDPIWYSIISTCPAGCVWTDYYNFRMEGSVLLSYNGKSIQPSLGSSQAFISQAGVTHAPYDQYCAKPSPISPDGGFIGKPLLSVDGHTDRWALCTNVTAGGRQDIVYGPVSGHANYDIGDCTEVYIQMAPYS